MLVVGSGGREHAIVVALASSDKVSDVFVSPGNGGTGSMGGKVRNVPALAGNDALATWAKDNRVDLCVIGPEVPLVEGAADALREKGVACFGPSQIAAEIEASKAWSKNFMGRHELRTARFGTFLRKSDKEQALKWVEDADFDVVVKASGLAAGKGVLVPKAGDQDAAKEAVLELFGNDDSANDEIVIEERLGGPEISLLAWCDGQTCECMPPAQDHKRARDGDRGLNTGGMGAYAPTPMISEAQLCEAREMMLTAVKGLAAEGRHFVGVLYGGFMLDPVRGPCLLEFNARFGDPETQVILPLLKSDCFDVMMACAKGQLPQIAPIQWRKASAATVVVASNGYPGKYEKGIEMSGVDEADDLPGVTVYHAGTKVSDGVLKTSGGRVVAVTAVSVELKGALASAYAGASRIRFKGAFYRGDVGRRCIDAPIKIGVLGSTRGTSLQALLDAAPEKVACVLSNKPDAPILERARKASVPIVKHVPFHQEGSSREAYCNELTKELVAANVDCVLLVGWMKILSSSFVKAWRGRCINVHPSLLPDFGGGMDLDVHAAVLKAGCDESGCTVHFVTEDVDGGAVIVQRKCSVTPGMTADELKAKVQSLEGQALIEAVSRFADGTSGERFIPRDYSLVAAAPSSSELKNDESSSQVQQLTYRSAGVDIDAGNALVERIKPLAKATAIPGVSGSLGGFGAVFDLKAAGFANNGSFSSDEEDGDDVLLVSGTDGVGTKLRLAAEALDATGKSHDLAIGIDLVAMCVNDIATTGASPLYFLDYYATGALDVERCASLVEGVAKGCSLSGCALVGGETAEMPGLYGPGDYDVAGFAVGAVRRRDVLPTQSAMIAGDALIALSSSGVHANGFSLVRAALSKRLDYPGGQIAALGAPATTFFRHSNDQDTLADALLAPTRLYATQIALARRVAKQLKGAAHITGGGLLENLPRVLPPGLAASVDADKISPLPPLFDWLRAVCGDLPDNEMLRTFNCGIGLILVVDGESAEAVCQALLTEANESSVCTIGCLVEKSGSEDQDFLLKGGPLLKQA